MTDDRLITEASVTEREAAFGFFLEGLDAAALDFAREALRPNMHPADREIYRVLAERIRNGLIEVTAMYSEVLLRLAEED